MNRRASPDRRSRLACVASGFACVLCDWRRRFMRYPRLDTPEHVSAIRDNPHDAVHPSDR